MNIGERFTVGDWVHSPPLHNRLDATLGLVRYGFDPVRVVSITADTVTCVSDLPVQRGMTNRAERRKGRR